MIKLAPEYVLLVQNILYHYVPQYEVRIFGSRVTENIKPYSDIDLVIMNQDPLPLSTIVALKQAFEESNLPYKVDIVEWCALSAAFQNRINANYEVIWAKKAW